MIQQRLKLICLAFLSMLVLIIGFEAKAQSYELNTSSAKLSLNANGELSIRSVQHPQILVSSGLDRLWSLSVKDEINSNEFSQKIYPVVPSGPPAIKKQQDVIVISYNQVKTENEILPVEITLYIGIREDQFYFSGELNSSAKNWQMRDFKYPMLSSSHGSHDVKIYLPNGLGQCFDNPAGFGGVSLDYPSGRCSMQWMSVNTKEQGLYLACYDSSRGKKHFNLNYEKNKKAFSSSVTFPVYSNAIRIPPVIVDPYVGQWYGAARKYRAWYNRTFTLPVVPAWVVNDAGWILAIMKQQNGHVMWKYADIDKLCDIATQLNLTTIGLFGWANGGHDYLYPNYIPDDLLGGRQALTAAIKRAHDRGIKIILYANGTLIDASTEYFRYNGNQTIALKEDKSAYTSSIRKYNSATPVVFVEASYSSSLWRKTMLDLALQAYELGADGILYDQVGVKSALLNFSKLQDHKLPQEAGTHYRYLMMNDIRNKLKALNPGFVIMTEGINDGIYSSVDYYHGWGEGTFIAPNSCPEIFRYTFPELVKTQRHSSPMLPRKQANFALVYGLRHEIETRWEADVDYLLRDKLPDETSYDDAAYFPPSQESINAVSPAEAKRYLHDLIAFESKYAEFFRKGTFTDEEDFSFSGKNMIAKGFKNGAKLGIIIWNTDEKQPQSYTITVQGYNLIQKAEPATEKVDNDNTIKANSVRLLIYQKQ